MQTNNDNSNNKMKLDKMNNIDKKKNNNIRIKQE